MVGRDGGHNTSYDSEYYQHGCLQTTPKIFRFSNGRKQNNISAKYRNNGSNIFHTNSVVISNEIQSRDPQLYNQKKVTNSTVPQKTNFGFIPDDDNCDRESTKSYEKSKYTTEPYKSEQFSANQSNVSPENEFIELQYYNNQNLDNSFLTKEVDI